jgi:hypothetical protein
LNTVPATRESFRCGQLVDVGMTLRAVKAGPRYKMVLKLESILRVDDGAVQVRQFEYEDDN